MVMSGVRFEVVMRGVRFERQQKAVLSGLRFTADLI